MSNGLEPCNSVDKDEALTSIAISLKRIADTICKPDVLGLGMTAVDVSRSMMQSQAHIFAGALMMHLERAIRDGMRSGAHDIVEIVRREQS